MVPVTGRQIRLVLLTTVGAMLSWLFVNTMFGVQWDSSIVSRLRAPSFTIEGISRSTKNEYDSSQYVNGPPTRFLHGERAYYCTFLVVCQSQSRLTILNPWNCDWCPKTTCATTPAT